MVEITDLLTNDTVLVAIISLLSGIVLTYVGAIVKFRRDLQSKYDIDLRNKRIKAYKLLWQLLEPLAYYSPATLVTYGIIQEMSEKMREWYYKTGGMFLSESSRDAYFDVQKEVMKVLEEKMKIILNQDSSKMSKLKNILNNKLNIDKDIDIDKVVGLAHESLKVQEEILKDKQDDKLETSDLKEIKSKASALRSSLSNDIGSRRESEIRND